MSDPTRIDEEHRDDGNERHDGSARRSDRFRPRSPRRARCRGHAVIVSVCAMMCVAISSAHVAAGDGAFSTWIWRGTALDEKSSTRLPSRCIAWARTPAFAGTRSFASMPERARRDCAANSDLDARSQHLLRTRHDVAGSQAPQTRPCERSGQLAHPDVPPAIPLAREGEHRVGAGVHGPVDHLREVHPEEREARVGHGVDEPVHERRRPRSTRSTRHGTGRCAPTARFRMPRPRGRCRAPRN